MLGQAEEIALPAVRSELIERASVDQELRTGLDPSAPMDVAAWRRIHIVDHANTARVSELVRQHGWLTRAMVGEDGSAAAWLLVQHADDDPAFQRRCLTLIEALPDGEVSNESRALLTDRVLLASGAPQRYGSQTEGDCTTGFRLSRLEDPDHVDERRAALGMESIASYIARMKTFYCSTHTRS
jgi:hypothetical protein